MSRQCILDKDQHVLERFGVSVLYLLTYLLSHFPKKKKKRRGYIP